MGNAHVDLVGGEVHLLVLQQLAKVCPDLVVEPGQVLHSPTQHSSTPTAERPSSIPTYVDSVAALAGLVTRPDAPADGGVERGQERAEVARGGGGEQVGDVLVSESEGHGGEEVG
jgi:hypothetical protein